MKDGAERQGDSLSRDREAGRKAHALMQVNVALALVLIAVITTVLVQHFSAGAQGQANADVQQDSDQPEYVDSDFTITQQSYDIYPGHDRVLYTNYACPYCAEFWQKTSGEGYTVRLLMLDKDGRFATQGTVSSFMLQLYRDDSDAFERMQEYLFTSQDEWVDLDDEEVLALLNGKAGKSCTFDDLAPARAECEQAKADAPGDLQFVPALYADGKRYDGYVLDLVGD